MQAGMRADPMVSVVIISARALQTITMMQYSLYSQNNKGWLLLASSPAARLYS